MLLGLVLEVLDNVRTDTGAVQPVEEAPGCKIALPAALAMEVLPSRDATEDDARHGRVAGQRERLLERDNGEQEQVREEVGAEDERWEVGGGET